MAELNKDICNLRKRCQEIIQLQSQLITENKALEITLEMKIVNQCTIEGQKLKILQSLQYPIKGDMTPFNPVPRLTLHNILHSYPPLSKRPVSSMHIDDVKKV